MQATTTTLRKMATGNYRMDEVDTTHDFEKGRIRALRDERLYIQKKTFTKWVNSFLTKVRIEVRYSGTGIQVLRRL